VEEEYATIPIKEFNSFFEGTANIKIINGYIEITINGQKVGQTLMITLPRFAGAKSTALLPHP